MQYVPVDGEHELLPGLRLVPAPGHTPGMQMVVVETGGRPVIVGGDVAVWFGEFDEPPRRPAAGPCARARAGLARARARAVAAPHRVRHATDKAAVASKLGRVALRQESTLPSQPWSGCIPEHWRGRQCLPSAIEMLRGFDSRRLHSWLNQDAFRSAPGRQHMSIRAAFTYELLQQAISVGWPLTSAEELPRRPTQAQETPQRGVSCVSGFSQTSLRFRARS